MDPKAEKYYGLSPFAYVGNKPLIFTDPRGDTIRAVNEVSAQRALAIFQNSLNSVSTARSLFSLSDDGITFNAIDMSQYNSVKGTLSQDEQILFESYATLINGSETNVVEVLRLGEQMSEYGKNSPGNFPQSADQLNMDSYGGQFNQAYYEGNLVRLGANGHYVAIVENATAPLEGSYSDGVLRPSRPGELMAHEWGHALGAQRGSNHLDTSVQLGNTYLRAKGASYYRKAHGIPSVHSPSFNPNRRVRRFGF